MRLIVTRPQPQADDWVARLRREGIEAAALPLIAIAPPADPVPVHAAWQVLGHYALVVFVSPNAVQRFFQAAPAGAAWPPGVWAGSPGPGTTQALAEAGVPPAACVAPAADAPQFDSESLWVQLQTLRDWGGARVLIVRGDGGREWLAQTLRDRGAQVDTVAAYRRGAPTLSGAERETLARALQEPSMNVWLFSSSEALPHLRQLAPAADWRPARAWATHPRIADHARAAGFGEVQALRPGWAPLLAAWRGQGHSIQSAAP